MCRDYVRAVVKLQDKHSEELKAAGIDDWILIGPGQPQFLKKYREDTGFRGQIFADPERVVYQALRVIRVKSFADLAAGDGSEYTGSQVKGWAWSIKRNVSMGMGKVGDARQQAATFVLDRDGTALFHHFERNPEDHPKIESVFRASGAKKRPSI